MKCDKCDIVTNCIPCPGCGHNVMRHDPEPSQLERIETKQVELDCMVQSVLAMNERIEAKLDQLLESRELIKLDVDRAGPTCTCGTSALCLVHNMLFSSTQRATKE